MKQEHNLSNYIGLAGPYYEMDIERGKIREFANAMYAPLSDFFEGRNPIIPATFLVSLPFWDMPTLGQLCLYFLIAIAGTLTHFCLNAALARADISSLLPLDYLRLIWSVSLGFVLFSEIPLPSIWMGSALIIMSTTYIAYRQVKKSKQPLTNQLNPNL